MVTFFHWFVAIYLVLSDVHTFYSLPAIQDSEIDYLRNFGYLPKKSESSDGLTVSDIVHGDTLTDAVKQFQKFAALEQTGVIDEATKRQFKMPRCGFPDIVEASEVKGRKGRRTKRFAIAKAKWELPRNGRHYVTWAFMNKNHPMNDADVGKVRRLIAEVVEVWQHNANLTFRELHPENKKDVDIEIDFARLAHGDGFDFKGPGETLAHAFQPGDKLGGDIHMDFDEDWDFDDRKAEEKGGSVNFFMTLLHEFGHSLGMLHSDSKDSIMFAWYQPNLDWDRRCKALFDDDVNGIAEIYGKKEIFKYGVTCIDRSSPHPPTKVPTRTTPRNEIPTYRTQRPRPREPNKPGIVTVRPDVVPYNPNRDSDRYVPKEKPDKCNTNFDAILYYRSELMIFKDEWFWRLRPTNNGKYEMLEHQPGKIGAMWPGLKGYDHIDAVFEMKDGNLAFFKDRKILIVDNNRKLIGASDVRHFGFHQDLKKVDAIFRWNHNNNTYVFSGSNFWKVDDNLRVVVDVDRYPRKIGHPFWKGVTDINVDTAVTDHNGVTYFLSGLFSYKFDNGYAKLDLDNPLISSQLWMLGCDFSQAEIDKIKNERQTSKAPPTVATTISPKKPRKKFYGGIIWSEAIDPNKINITAIAGNLSNQN